MSAVTLTGVGKSYRFYQRPSDRIVEWFARKARHTNFWALRGVDLAVEPGETFGVIGENGAGKSTLLKVVAGTSKPTEGELVVDGRIAALLELGGGFHPEQSGRENVYMMAALNGISPRQADAYYEQCVSFSELPVSALQRPVKTYSSGMFMRLAFAAATSIDPEILIIDEALSVGDIRFQKKSLDRIMNFRDRGKTVLFCSHNMYQIRSLCQRAIWLGDGQVQELGETEPVVTAFETYLAHKEAEMQAEHEIRFRERASGSQPGGLAPVRINKVTVSGADDKPSANLRSFEPASIAIEVESREQRTLFHIGVAIVKPNRENVFGTSTHFETPDKPLCGGGIHRLRVEFDRLTLLSGQYRVSVYALDDTGLQVYDMAESICEFVVHNAQEAFGLVYLPHEWHRG